MLKIITNGEHIAVVNSAKIAGFRVYEHYDGGGDKYLEFERSNNPKMSFEVSELFAPNIEAFLSMLRDALEDEKISDIDLREYIADANKKNAKKWGILGHE